jgi:hypothetical protein
MGHYVPMKTNRRMRVANLSAPANKHLNRALLAARISAKYRIALIGQCAQPRGTLGNSAICLPRKKGILV